MDLVEFGDVGSGCGDKNCGLGFDFQEDFFNQDCHFGVIELVCVTVIYIPLMLFGLLGNILTILVVWLRPHMRSSTYLYLSSMAVSDLLILLLLPLDLYKLWRPRPWLLGDLTCKLTMFLSECCTFCTILHITFLSLERYVAVCWPITAKTWVTRRRTRTLIGCLWLGAAVSAAPVLLMVGVEEVGGEERFGGWREDSGWMVGDGEQGGFVMGGMDGGVAHMAMIGGGMEEMMWHEKDSKGLGETEKMLGEEVERKLGIQETGEIKARGNKHGIDDKRSDKRGVGDEGGTLDDDKMPHNKMREDEGGGTLRGVDMDRRECRCTDYAVSSGLLSAMMILSNLYFLIPLSILGLVYSLIGRTLWLRPQSSRKDQSHRHTIKMLGVIVLAFVLCWLPFHVGRTILTFSLGMGAERQETYMDTNLPLDLNEGHSGHPGPDPPSPTLPQTGDQILSDSCSDGKDNVDAHGDGEVGTRSEKKRLSSNVTSQNTHRAADGGHTNTTTYNSQQSPLGHTPPTTEYNAHTDTELFMYYLSQYFNLVSSVLYYLSAAINPLLYNLMSTRYRHAVHSLAHTHCHAHSHRMRTTISAQNSTTIL